MWGIMSTREEIKSAVLKFIDCINAGDSERLKAHQTEDFTFIDMEGDVHVGRDGWEDYFSDHPEYKIHIQNILVSGTGVAIIGKTTGSHVDSKVEVLETVLWIAEVWDGLIARWRIYADGEEAKKALNMTS